MRKIFFLGLLFAGCVQTLGAQELIRNGGFEENAEGWILEGKCAFDTSEKTEGTQSLLVVKESLGTFNELRQKVNVEPNTEYELTYDIKCDHVEMSDPQTKAFGVSVCLVANGKRLSYGSEGLWKYDNGTFDWKKAVVRFNTGTLGNPDVLQLGFQCPFACGIFRLDAVSLRKVASAKEPFRISVFPCCFLGRQTYTIAENLIGTVFLTSKKDKQVKFAENAKAIMILDLPPFLRMAGATDRFILQRQGKYSQVAYPYSVEQITRDGQPYRRYTISFDSSFVRLLGASWYHQKIFLIPERGSAGQEGTIYWSFMIGNDRQAEISHPVAIHESVLNTGASCRRFELDVGYSSIHGSPFPELRNIMTAYWKSLTVSPALALEMGQGSDPDYSATCYLNGDDPFVDMPHGRIAWAQYRAKAPKDVKVSGVVIATTPSWFKLEDPDRHYETYLRESLRTALKLHPEIKVIRWDYEPERTGYDPEGRARFARHLGLSETPSIEEIGQKYRTQWREYTLVLNARFISKVAKIVKEEAPGCRFDVVSELLHNNKVSHWCDVDMRLIDQDPNIDVLAGMPYFGGAAFFDEIGNNLHVIRKPLFFAQDPSERLWSFWSQYTPGRLFQNILATAALGGRGICHWPDDSMIAEYYKVFADAYGLIAQYEDVYFEGKRVDDEFTLIPQNAVTKIISTVNGGKTALHFPDFNSSTRMIVHKYDEKYYFTIFNYNEKESVILRIQGNGMDFLVEIPAGWARVIEADHPDDQEALARAVEDFRSKVSTEAIKDFTDGVNSAAWTLGSSGKPVLRLTNAHWQADIDAANDGELVGFRQESGAADPMMGGRAARLKFYDPEQPDILFRQTKTGLKDGIPFVEFEAEVPAYSGAVPRENPLLGLKITRTYALTPDGLNVSFRLFNPSSHVMNCGFRIWNFPQTGSRFGGKNLILTCSGIEIGAGAPDDNCFLKTPLTETESPGKRRKAFYLWQGDKAVSSAADGELKESIEFVPGDGFEGIYVWNSTGNTPGHTVELKTPEILLQPGTGIEFMYRIR